MGIVIGAKLIVCRPQTQELFSSYWFVVNVLMEKPKPKLATELVQDLLGYYLGG